MRNNYNKMKRQLQSLRKENEYLRDDNELMHNMYDTSFQARLKADNDNFNLQELTKLGTSLSIIMSQMLGKCDDNTMVGSAYKSAILQFQRALAEGFGYARQSNNDNSSMSRVIRKALNATKAELGEGMLSLPHFNINKIINDSTDEE